MFSGLMQEIKRRLKVYSGYFLIIVVLLLIVSLTRGILKIFEAQKKIEKKKQDIAKLEEENKNLREKLGVITSEEFTEKQLRDKLGLVKEGELVIVLPDEETLRKLAPEPKKDEEILPDPYWKKWINLFF